MRRAEGERSKRRWRLVLGWLITALVVAVYFALPGGNDDVQLEPAADSHGERSLEIMEISPARAAPGEALTITYAGARDGATVEPYAGKVRLEVLARYHGSLVARLPSEGLPERVKIRVADGAERSKPFVLVKKAPNYRKPFRNLLGGFALLLFGISVLARGAREAAGLGSAQTLARFARRKVSALGLGAVLGVLAQSTTASAGILAGLVASSLLAVGPAAIAFLGAQLGAATAPLATSLIDAREGLLAIAIGVFWLALSSDRRSAALSRLVLGVGLMAFGLQTFRPGFEPFAHDPMLLEVVARLKANGAAEVALCASLGALLVAIFQGPAPVVVLVLVLAQTTAQWDLRTARAVLAGSGLGAAIGSLLTTPAARRCRQLAILNLMLGLLSTLVCVASLDLWTRLADLVVPGLPHDHAWGRRVLLPNLGLHLGAAFALSQLCAACVLLPVASPLARWLDRRQSRTAATLPRIGDAAGVGRAELVAVLQAQCEALKPLGELVRDSNRSAGRITEHRLAEAHAALEELLQGPVLSLPDTPEGRQLGRAAFTNMQLQRSLEGLHRQAERLVDSRVAISSGSNLILPLPHEDVVVLSEMHTLLYDGASSLCDALRNRQPLDLDDARAREIRMNGLEARVRGSLFDDARGSARVGSHLTVLELVDAYESAGNQLYRLVEALGQSAAEASAARVV
jgi:Na+/phosphate symporter